MVYLAKELLPRLKHLVIWGVNDDGQLEWAGTNEQYAKMLHEDQVREDEELLALDSRAWDIADSRE